MKKEEEEGKTIYIRQDRVQLCIQKIKKGINRNKMATSIVVDMVTWPCGSWLG